jgi:Pup amidohydrolase
MEERVGLPKYVGTETEYGIAVVSRPEMNPVLASSMVVSAYQPTSPRKQVRWDHTDEHPLRDARGFEGTEVHEDPSDEDVGLANSVLTNGARFYVDHAHPEYSTPECSNARDLVVWDKAGERILEEAAARATDALTEGGRFAIHKNNTDGKGAAYGTHENYLLDRSVPFGSLVRQLIPFFVSRPIYVGAGRIGSEHEESVDFQLTQRAEFFEVEVGLETTLKRPLINTRDEPHADPDKYRRLHVINGDANLCEVATYLKVGVTSLILAMIEDGAAPDPLELHRPVEAFHSISRDLSATGTVKLRDGRQFTALDIQWRYLEAVKDFVARIDLDPVSTDVMRRWEEVLTTAESDPRKLAGTVDWATKLELLEQYRDRHDLDWDDDRLKMVDLQYHDVRLSRGLYNRLAARGRVERIVSDDEVRRAMTEPPDDTRAYFRGRCLARFREQIVAAGWDSLIFDLGGEALQRVPMMEPARGTKAHVGTLLEGVESARELLDAITG